MDLRDAIREAPVGKKLPDSYYVHVSAMRHVPEPIADLIVAADEVSGEFTRADLVKVMRDGSAVTFLEYPEFDEDPHPAMARATRVDLDTGSVRVMDYSGRASPPILHRKDSFVAPDYPRYDEFAELTREEEARGLLNRPGIGTLLRWNDLLEQEGVRIEGHEVRTAMLRIALTRYIPNVPYDDYGYDTANAIVAELPDEAVEILCIATDPDRLLVWPRTGPRDHVGVKHRDGDFDQLRNKASLVTALIQTGWLQTSYYDDDNDAILLGGRPYPGIDDFWVMKLLRMSDACNEPMELTAQYVPLR